MSILDLLDDGNDTTYRFMILEYGLDDPPWRATWRSQDWDTVSEVQACIQTQHQLAFTDPPELLLVEGNLGNIAHKHKWNVAVIYRVDTGEVVSVGWLTPPVG